MTRFYFGQDVITRLIPSCSDTPQRMGISYLTVTSTYYPSSLNPSRFSINALKILLAKQLVHHLPYIFNLFHMLFRIKLMIFLTRSFRLLLKNYAVSKLRTRCYINRRHGFMLTSVHFNVVAVSLKNKEKYHTCVIDVVGSNCEWERWFSCCLLLWIFVHVFGCLLLSASHDNNVYIFLFKYCM